MSEFLQVYTATESILQSVSKSEWSFGGNKNRVLDSFLENEWSEK